MKSNVIIVCVIAFVFGMVSVSSAVLFHGEPDPSHPTFGRPIDFDDKEEGPVGEDDYAEQGVASITETEGLVVGAFGYYDEAKFSKPMCIGTGPDSERWTDEVNKGWDGTILIEFKEYASRTGVGIVDIHGAIERIAVYGSIDDVLFANPLEMYEVPKGIGKNDSDDGEGGKKGSNVYVGIDRWGRYDIRYLEIKGDGFTIDDLQFDVHPSIARGMRALEEAPEEPGVGEVYFDTAMGMAYIYDGMNWDEYRGPVGPPGADGSSDTPEQVLQKITQVDGSGSGLDADTLDGMDSGLFANLSHIHDDRYYTESELNTDGGGGNVHWGNLTDVPAGFSDNIDDTGIMTEADPVYSTSAASGIDAGDIADWNRAYGWANHALAVYLSTLPGSVIEEGGER